jgi:hypothetical protein
MPRFVRTLCRSLQTDRDLVSVIGSYRKVAGPELGGELDILLVEMQSGNVQSALVHFENRIGSPEAFRLCAALSDMSLGVDQTATLSYYGRRYGAFGQGKHKKRAFSEAGENAQDVLPGYCRLYRHDYVCPRRVRYQ